VRSERCVNSLELEDRKWKVRRDEDKLSSFIRLQKNTGIISATLTLITKRPTSGIVHVYQTPRFRCYVRASDLHHTRQRTEQEAAAADVGL
jgi:hypothetical protein